MYANTANVVLAILAAGCMTLYDIDMQHIQL